MKPNRPAVAVLVGFILVLTRAAGSQEKVAAPAPSKAEIRSVLIQARDALIETVARDPATYDSAISESLKRLTQWLMKFGDRDDVRYLQEHLTGHYALETRGALGPAATREDFAARAKSIEEEKDRYRHDDALQALVSQEIDRGFLDEAAAHAEKIHYRVFAMRALRQVAVAQLSKGDKAAAEQAIDAAIAASVQVEEKPFTVTRPAGKLRELAGFLHDEGHDEVARKVLERYRGLIESLPHDRDFTWAGLAESAVNAGDLEIAEEAMSRAGEFSYRAGVEDGLNALRALKATPHEGARIAATVSNPYTRIKTTCEIAERLAAVGDREGAAAALQDAQRVADEDEQFQVSYLIDIVWAQIRSKDKGGAEKTLEWALQANEKHRWGGDQLRGWEEIVDAMAYLGHFDRAHQIAERITYHDYKANALNSLAFREGQAGHTKEAFAWAVTINNPEERSGALMGLAEAMVENYEDATKR